MMVRKIVVGALAGALALTLPASFASAAKGGKSAANRQDTTKGKSVGKRQDGSAGAKGTAASAAKAGNGAAHSNKHGSKHPHGVGDATTPATGG